MNLTSAPTNINLPLNLASAFDLLQQLNPSVGKIYIYKKGKFIIQEVKNEKPQLKFPIMFLFKNNQIFLIKEVSSAGRKCDFCGDFYKSFHSCSVRRRDYYFHHIHHKSSDWWEKISFCPIGAPKETKRLFITYDVETYTWHGKYGKQLVPFLLVFHISGDEELVSMATKKADELQWLHWDKAINTYFYLSPLKKDVGNKFKIFRNELQQIFTLMLWNKFKNENVKLQEMAKEKNLCCEDFTYKQIESMKTEGNPCFIEIYVVGHNINGFDEIVLAAQVIAQRNEIPLPFKISRNFMPRNGKILFNDITFALPNPLYKKRTNFEEWELGIMEASDMKHQFVKFMVRDTFALTHTSLRNAASAYALEVEKGNCPYQAVNDFYRLGTYQKDSDGFPDVQYWKDVDEYHFNKNLWKEQKQDAYDIIQQTLNYCAQDVLVTSKLVLKLQSSYKEFISNSANLPGSDFNIFQRPTISSNSHAIFKQMVFSEEKPSVNTLGNIILAPSNEMYEYVRNSIRGGRCYPTYIGILDQPIYVYDICGMYASALTHPFPSGSPLNPFERAIAVNKWEQKLNCKNNINYFDEDLLPAIFTIDAEPPLENMLDVLPPYCSRRGGRLCWTNEPLRAEVATSIDVITLHNRGWKVTILPDERTTVFPEWKCIARNYVQLNILAKEKADKEKNQTIRSIAKLLSNALYGSFATKLDNKKIVFSDQMEESDTKNVSTGKYTIKSSSFIETDTFSAEIMPEFVVAYPPSPTEEQEASNENDQIESTFIHNVNHVTYKYKPITFLDIDDEDICLHTLEKNSPLIENKRYPSQIAAFVLAWTRAFMSEWCMFLYSEDLGIPLHERTLKSVYGDTDSIFLTEAGRKAMEEKGKKRIKKYGGKLIFDPKNPDLTWLVECETQCSKCGSDAFSEESVFLAPKLYALKNTVCTSCGYVGKGKLRAKGHATTELSYQTLARCYMEDIQQGSDKFQTSRMTLKRTLATIQSNAQPFTVTESTLTRTLRPWKDKTLYQLDINNLIPYSKSNPNPRNQDICWMNWE